MSRPRDHIRGPAVRDSAPTFRWETNMTKTLRIALMLLAMTVWGPVAHAAELTFVAAKSLGTRAHQLVLNDSGTLAYVATDLGLTIVDVHDPTNPIVLGSAKVRGKSYGLALQGTHVYLASVGLDLVVIDVSDPTAPAVVASRSIPGYARDVAVKDTVDYVASFSGEVYAFDASEATDPRLVKVIGLPTWIAGNDKVNLDRLKNSYPGGNAKVTSVSMVGDKLFALDCNYGRLYYFDVSTASDPTFLGTHFAAFAFQVQGSPDGNVAYILGAFGNASNVFSVPVSILDPDKATRQTQCPACGTFKITATDYGGITVSDNGKYVVYIAGKRGIVQVLDVSNPPAITDAGSFPLPRHGIKTLETMGVKSSGNFIYTAAGLLGLQVFSYPHLSD